MIARVFISGFVQGVGFRQFVLRQAQHLRLTGWVKNVSDGRVEVLFQGPEDKIKKAVEECNKGPFLSEVKDVVVEWENASEIYKAFKIV